MKHSLRVLLAVIFAAFMLVGTAGAQSRIGTVDLQKVYDSYWRQKQAFAALKEHAAELEKEDKALRDEYKKSAEAYQKLRDDANDQAVSPEEREKRKKNAEARLKDLKDSEETIRQYEIQAQTKISEQRRRIRDKSLEEIRAAISAKAKTGGHSLVIDVSAKSANSTLELISMAIGRQDPAEEHAKTTPVVLYNSPETDLTASVIEQLNSTAPTTDTPKPPEKKAEKK